MAAYSADGKTTFLMRLPRQAPFSQSTSRQVERRAQGRVNLQTVAAAQMRSAFGILRASRRRHDVELAIEDGRARLPPSRLAR